MQFFTQASITRQAEQRSRQSYQSTQHTRTAQHHIIGEKTCQAPAWQAMPAARHSTTHKGGGLREASTTSIFRISTHEKSFKETGTQAGSQQNGYQSQPNRWHGHLRHTYLPILPPVSPSRTSRTGSIQKYSKMLFGRRNAVFSICSSI